jgi:hypothetical protein
MERGIKDRSRSEVQDQVEQNKDALQEGKEKATVPVEDAETIADTLDALERGGTSDGTEAINQAIDAAGGEAESEFEQLAGEWDETRNEGEEQASEMDDGKQSVESDLGRISDASADVQTEGVVNELIDAKENAIQDIEFLEEQISDSNDAIEESSQAQRELEQKLQTARRGN